MRTVPFLGPIDFSARTTWVGFAGILFAVYHAFQTGQPFDVTSVLSFLGGTATVTGRAALSK